MDRGVQVQVCILYNSYMHTNRQHKNLMQVCMHLTCWAMLSFITMFPIWSSSCASEVMVVVAVATFSTLRLHMRRSSSQSASPVLLHGATRKPAGGVDDCTPSNSLTGHGTGQLPCVYRKSNTRHTVGIHLPKLCKKDSHDFGHVDVDVNREHNLWSI